MALEQKIAQQQALLREQMHAHAASLAAGTAEPSYAHGGGGALGARSWDVGAGAPPQRVVAGIATGLASRLGDGGFMSGFPFPAHRKTTGTGLGGGWEGAAAAEERQRRGSCSGGVATGGGAPSGASVAPPSHGASAVGIEAALRRRMAGLEGETGGGGLLGASLGAGGGGLGGARYGPDLIAPQRPLAGALEAEGMVPSSHRAAPSLGGAADGMRKPPPTENALRRHYTNAAFGASTLSQASLAGRNTLLGGGLGGGTWRHDGRR